MKTFLHSEYGILCSVVKMHVLFKKCPRIIRAPFIFVYLLIVPLLVFFFVAKSMLSVPMDKGQCKCVCIEGGCRPGEVLYCLIMFVFKIIFWAIYLFISFAVALSLMLAILIPYILWLIGTIISCRVWPIL